MCHFNGHFPLPRELGITDNHLQYACLLLNVRKQKKLTILFEQEVLCQDFFKDWVVTATLSHTGSAADTL